MSAWQEFAGLNRGYVLELYERYRTDPRRSISPPARSSSSGRRRRESPPSPLRMEFATTIVGAAQPGAIDPALRASRRTARSARPPPIGDPSLSPRRARRHRDGSARAAGALVVGPVAERRRAIRGRSSGCAQVYCSTPGSTTRTCSCRRSASGCGTPPSPAGSARRWTRSIRSRCSIA